MYTKKGHSGKHLREVLKKFYKKIKEIIDLMIDNDYFIYADTHLNTIFIDNNLWK